jgi:hypothetical protein
MKKILLLLVVFVIGAAGAFAVTFDILSYPAPLDGGNILVDVGLGFTGVDKGSLTIPPLRVSAEYALPVEVPISVGGLVAIHGAEWKVPGWSSTLSWTYFTFGARGNWHWGLDIPWLDLYTGLFLGYQVVSYDLPSGFPEPSYGGFVPGGQLGAHFYFTDMIGALVEFGYPYWANIALALKF